MKRGPVFPMFPFTIALLSVAAMLLWTLDPVRGFGGDKFYQVSLRSSLFADYSADPRMQAGLAPLNLRIIEEVIREDQPTTNAGEILEQLQTPVLIVISTTLTATPLSFNPTNTAVVGATVPNPNQTLTSSISLTPTATWTLVPTLTLTRTPGSTATDTPTPAPPTFTPVSATATRTPTRTTVPTGYPPPPTATPVAPTATPAGPTATPGAPTATTIVPTPTQPYP